MTDAPPGGRAPSGTDASEAGPPTSPAGERRRGGVPPEEEPTTTGTLFIMVLFLMAMGALWVLMYLTLLER